jgi:hypothetical protein
MDHLHDAVAVFHGGLPADLRVRAGTEALGDARADLQRGLDRGVLERLRIGVDAHELHALDAAVHHVRDGVAATSTDAQHLDDCALAVCVHEFEHAASPVCEILISEIALEPTFHPIERRSRSARDATGASAG